LWLWCGCSICQLLNLTIYQNDICHENFTVFFFPNRKAKLLTKTRKLTNFDLLCSFVLRAVVSVLKFRRCPITPRRLSNGFHKFLFKSLHNFLSLQAQWLVYVPTGLTLKNSTFCPHSVFMCLVCISEQTAILYLYSANWLAF